ncbi:NADH pyrophosphatase zinc ribbon domain-containing protein [Micromonospora sp. NPDC005172]
MAIEVVAMVFGGLVPGFLLGLWAFRVKSRWCPRCGQPTQPLSQGRAR